MTSHLITFYFYFYYTFLKCGCACPPAVILLPAPVHPPALASSRHSLLSALMMPCCECLHSVISLLTVGMLSVFVSPFSFFMHSTTLRRPSASPANSSMFSPCTLLPCFHSARCIITLPPHLPS